MAYDTIIRVNKDGDNMTAPYVRYSRCSDGHTRHNTTGVFAVDTAWADTAHLLSAASTSCSKGFGWEIPTLDDGVYLIEFYEKAGATAADTDTLIGQNYLVMPSKQIKTRMTTTGQGD